MAAASSSPKDGDINLKCPVCLDFFDGKKKAPKTLPCGHTFCKACLFSLPPTTPGGQRIKCASCQNYTIMRPQLTNIADNFALKDLALQRVKELTKQFECMECDELSEIGDMFRCGSCAVNICRNCWVMNHYRHKELFSYSKLNREGKDRIDSLSRQVTHISNSTIEFGHQVGSYLRLLKRNAKIYTTAVTQFCADVENIKGQLSEIPALLFKEVGRVDVEDMVAENRFDGIADSIEFRSNSVVQKRRAVKHTIESLNMAINSATDYVRKSSNNLFSFEDHQDGDNDSDHESDAGDPGPAPKRRGKTAVPRN